MRPAFADILVPPVLMDIMYLKKKMTEQNLILVPPVLMDIMYLKKKMTNKNLIFYKFLSDCFHIWHVNEYKWEGRCEPIWTQYDYFKAPPNSKDVSVLTLWHKYMLKPYNSLSFLVLHISPVWWGLHHTLVVPLDSTYSSPGSPKLKKMFILLILTQNSLSDYFYILQINFYMIVWPWNICIINV